MVVMDKHGMDKERYPFPVTPAELFTLIDSLPLRKEEMQLQGDAGQACAWLCLTLQLPWASTFCCLRFFLMLHQAWNTEDTDVQTF